MDGRHSFRGYSDTLLRWRNDNQLWTLQSYSNESITATVNVNEYPFGTHKWFIKGDSCFETNGAETTLNINACSNEDFNCVDGHCIPIDGRCNGKVECPEKTGFDYFFSFYGSLNKAE